MDADSGGFLSAPQWPKDRWCGVEHLKLYAIPAAGTPHITGREAHSDHVIPYTDKHTRISRYSHAMQELMPPKLFVDRLCYRLLAAQPIDGGMSLNFAAGGYFDVIDICEALAHEYAAADLHQRDRLPLREAVGDPFGFGGRIAVPGVSVLTVRRDDALGETSTFLHWRDAAKVGSAGRQFGAAPAGLFQPSNDAAYMDPAELDLWRAIFREYCEEFGGMAEIEQTDYTSWALFRKLQEGRERGSLRLTFLGLGVDALSYVPELLILAVFDAELFDSAFPRAAGANGEGRLFERIPFTPDLLDRLTGTRLHPACGALLNRAWTHRATLVEGG